jgi:hypothetical protein
VLAAAGGRKQGENFHPPKGFLDFQAQRVWNPLPYFTAFAACEKIVCPSQKMTLVWYFKLPNPDETRIRLALVAIIFNLFPRGDRKRFLIVEITILALQAKLTFESMRDKARQNFRSEDFKIGRMAFRAKH